VKSIMHCAHELHDDWSWMLCPHTDILSLGTPADLLPRVRQITSEADLDALQSVLPLEAYEGLFLVAAGDTVSQVLSAREPRWIVR
jgi:hypothetical protein